MGSSHVERANESSRTRGFFFYGTIFQWAVPPIDIGMHEHVKIAIKLAQYVLMTHVKCAHDSSRTRAFSPQISVEIFFNGSRRLFWHASMRHCLWHASMSHCGCS